MTTPDSRITSDGSVLAAIDESAYARSVCHYAAWAAARLAAPLELVHVLPRVPAGKGVDLSGNLVLGEQENLLRELSGLDEKRAQLAQERGRLLLQQARQMAAEAGAPDAQTRLRHGGLVDTLVELEEGVRLFVLGKRGEHADFARGHLGSQLERVARAAHRPLLVAAREFQPVRRVLVAFDGSATTRRCVELVAASPLFAELDIALVQAGRADGEGIEWARRTIAAAGLPVEAAVLEGEPEDVLAAYVREQRIDLLVMGAYGHSRIRQLVVGSTTTAMLRNCRIPVLLLR